MIKMKGTRKKWPKERKNVESSIMFFLATHRLKQRADVFLEGKSMKNVPAIDNKLRNAAGTLRRCYMEIKHF